MTHSFGNPKENEFEISLILVMSEFLCDDFIFACPAYVIVPFTNILNEVMAHSFENAKKNEFEISLVLVTSEFLCDDFVFVYPACVIVPFTYLERSYGPFI
jgi:hypothetical protein